MKKIITIGIILMAVCFFLGCTSSSDKEMPTEKTDTSPTETEKMNTEEKIEETPKATQEPTPKPTKVPTPEPTKEITPKPTQVPTPEPTEEPTPEPTEEPTPEPTEEPTPEPVDPVVEMKKSILECLEISESKEADSCLFAIAEQYNDNTACKDIKDNNNDITGKDACHRKIATVTLDKTPCELIEKTEDQYNCFIDIAVAAKDDSFCELIETLPYMKNSCYLKVGPAMGSQEVCDKIGNEKNREQCYRNLVVFNPDVTEETICDSITEYEDLKEMCLAALNQDRSICNGMPDYNDKSWCHAYVSIRSGDIENCKLVEDSNAQEECNTYLS